MADSSGSTPYASFADVVSRFHAVHAAGPSSASAQLDAPMPYEEVLDEGNGMVEALMGSLEKYLQGREGVTPQEREAMLLEHRTWALIRAVYDNRLHRADPEFVTESAAAQVRASPYTPPEEVVQTIVNEDAELSLWATLVDHLQTRPLFTSAPPIETKSGYLPSTMRRAKAQKLNSGAASTSAISYDPDFTLRDPHGPGLAGEDQTYQAPLLEVLFDLVRHGELDQAVNVCEQGGEPWRAASIMGGRRWNMGGLAVDKRALTPLEGNRTRALWKKSCRAIAKNPTLSGPERHLYAALISDLPTLLPACTTWEDQMWAHIQHRMELRIDKRWHELGGFWEAEDQLYGSDDVENIDIGRGGLDEVFASIAAVNSGAVSQASQNPYYVAQRMVILGRAASLLETFADRIPGLEQTVLPELIGPLVRFFVHLVLVLRSVNEPVPESAANVIIEAYLMVLKSEGNDSLVAMYAACLREGNGEESYARFLRSMDPNATAQQKQDALMLAKQHSLDVATIAKLTVSHILKHEFETIPALSTDQPDITAFSARLDERDVRLIRSLEWLTFVPETRGEALVRANDITRYFLALGKANAAHALLRSLPSFASITEEEDGDNQLLEHEQYTHLFGIFAAHDAVDKALAEAPKATATKIDQAAWRKLLLSAVERVHADTVALLTSRWLRFSVRADSRAADRRKELRRIRQIFVPDLVLRLHHVLVDNRARLPDAPLLQRALDLTKLVAAEEHHVYDEFLGQDDRPFRLVAYLDRVREASLDALAAGSMSPFIA